MAQPDSSVPSNQEKSFEEVNCTDPRFIHDILIPECNHVCPYFPLSGYAGVCCNPNAKHQNLYSGICIMSNEKFPWWCPLPYKPEQKSSSEDIFQNIQNIPKSELEGMFRVKEVIRLYYESNTFGMNLPLYALMEKLCEDDGLEILTNEKLEAANVMRTAASYIKMLEERLSQISRRDSRVLTKIKQTLDDK